MLRGGGQGQSESVTTESVTTRIPTLTLIESILGSLPFTRNKELAVTSQQFGLVAGIFFCYFVFEIPSNLLMHRIGARI